MFPSKYIQLADRLANYIRNNNLHGRLPGGPTLAKLLGVNHITLAKATARLASQGMLVIKPHEGTYVVEPPEWLKRRHHRVIGLIGFPVQDSQATPYIESINKEISDSGYRVMVLGGNNRMFHDTPQLLVDMPVDGLFFFGSTITRRIADTLNEAKIPVICTVNSNFPELNQVGMDAMEGYIRAARLLKKRGCRRIASIHYERQFDFRNYITEIRQALKFELGQYYHPELFMVYNATAFYDKFGERYRDAIVRNAMRQWKENPPDGLISMTDVTSRLHGILDIPIVEFAPIPGNSGVEYTMCENLPEMLHCGVRRILELLRGDTSVQTVSIPFNLRTRDN